MHKGILIQIPTGSNKTYFLKKLSKKDKKIWLDGEKVLKKFGIKNKMHYWYDNNNSEKIEKIERIFTQILNKGFNILFSGNPLKIKTDIIILPDMNVRWGQIKRKKMSGGWVPDESLFSQELLAYQKAILITPIVINGDIPDIKTLNSFNYHFNFKNKINNILS